MPESGSIHPPTENNPPTTNINTNTPNHILKDVIAVGGGVAAASATASVIAGADAVRSIPEILATAQNSQTKFEPFAHSPIVGSTDLDLDYNIAADDPALEARLLAFHPHVLTVDTLYVPETEEEKNSLNYKKQAWQECVVRAYKLNPEEKYVYEIAGDMVSGINYSYFQKLFKHDQERYNTFATKYYQKFMQLTGGFPYPTITQHERDENRISEFARLAAELSTVVGIAGYRKVSESLREHPTTHQSHTTEEIASEKKENRISRRAALGRIAGTAAAAFFIGNALLGNAYPQEQVAYVGSEREKDAYELLENAMDADISLDVWLDGRTALEIEKHLRAMEYLRQHGMISDDAMGAIPMGYEHDIRAREFLVSQEKRMQAIQIYAQKIVPFVTRALQSTRTPQQQINIAVKNVLDYYASYGIIKVNDPGYNKFQYDGADDYINKNVQYLATLPCDSIAKAVQHLSPLPLNLVREN